MEENPTPWKKTFAILLAILTIAVVVTCWNRLGKDFWPLDRSYVGPNIVASVMTWTFVLIVAALIWPPTRRAIHRFVEGKLEAVHDHIARDRREAKEHREWEARHLASLYKSHTGRDAVAHPHFGHVNTEVVPIHIQSLDNIFDEQVKTRAEIKSLPAPKLIPDPQILGLLGRLEGTISSMQGQLDGILKALDNRMAVVEVTPSKPDMTSEVEEPGTKTARPAPRRTSRRKT